MWAIVIEQPTRIVNVMPAGDWNTHVASPFCSCNPHWNKDGVLVHAAFDNRQFLESQWEGDVQVLMSDSN